MNTSSLPVSDAVDEAENRLVRAMEAYEAAFNCPPPYPVCISDAYHARVLEEAIAIGCPVPDDFNWYAHLPPDAVA